jgi:hypothetical protein
MFIVFAASVIGNHPRIQTNIVGDTLNEDYPFSKNYLDCFEKLLIR